MQRIARLVGGAYVGLFLSFLCWALRLGLAPLPDAHRMHEGLSGPGLVGICLVPLLGLLISHWCVRRRRFRGAAVAFVLCVCLSASNLVDTTNTAWKRMLPTVAGEKRTIASAIRPGADVSTVLNFLEKNRIDHSEYGASTRQVRGIIRVRPRGWFHFEGAICMVFRFNRRQKLADYQVDEQWIAP